MTEFQAQDTRESSRQEAIPAPFEPHPAAQQPTSGPGGYQHSPGQSWSGSPEARLGHRVLIIAKREVKLQASSLKIKLHLRSPEGKGVWAESEVLL